MPSGGGTGIGRRASSTPAVDPLMQVQWVAELLRVRTATDGAAPVTGTPEAPEAGKPEAGKAAEKTETRPRLRGLDLPRNGEKPVLVYFHWPHEDGDRGKRIVKFCSGPMDDEAFVRMTPLFHCVEVNTRDSESRLVEEAKVASTPALLVCAPDGTIVWRSDDGRLSGKALAASLRKVLQEEFPGRWTEIEKEMKFQKETLAEARALSAQRRHEDAAFALRQVVGSDVRFTEEWAEARKVLADVERRVEREAEGR